MSLNAAAGISAVLGVPLTAAPVGFTIHNALQSLRPYSKFKKWVIRVQQIVAAVAADGNMITPEELEEFLTTLGNYVTARDKFQKRINDGTCTWYGKGRDHAADFAYYARAVWYNGHELSTESSKRKLELVLNNAQTSAVRVPATSISEISLHNKGKSRQESSLSDESPLKNGLHWKKSIDTAKSSQPSTSDSVPAITCNCLRNESQLSSSLHANVDLEEDKEDDSNDMTPEEVEALCKFLRRQNPEKKRKALGSQQPLYPTNSELEEK